MEKIAVELLELVYFSVICILFIWRISVNFGISISIWCNKPPNMQNNDKSSMMHIPPATSSSASASPSHKSQLSGVAPQTLAFGPGPISGITHRLFHPPKLER